ncbi:TonB-dependent receptor plug domain-containing protein [Phenylobacterium sp.]|uniref:TonB-dependent receptor plug domain-containing protein n=1 Tax=Phenylobacterium sp. TaxID=1871053 RepID=UPI00374CC240
MKVSTRRALFASVSIAATVLTGAADAADAASADKAVDELIVTGTRSTSRTVTTSLAPIDVLTAAALTKSGKISTRDLISTLVPSANTSNSGAGASFAIKTLSIRGLAGDQTLVLVNGKRRHNTSILFVNGTTQNGQAPPDLDLIPSAGIARIEVLRDGASAQYGSDALAGVVNIILKSEAGGEAQALTGATYQGDGKTAQVSVNYGWKLADKGFFNATLNAQTTTLIDRGNKSPITAVLYPLINGQPDPREATADRTQAHPGAPASQLYVGSYNTEYDIGDGIKAYSFGTLSSRYSAAWLTYRLPTASNNIISVYPNGYAPRLFLHDRDYQFAVGLKGEKNGYNWDLSSTLGRNKNIFDTNSLNASLGPASPTYFYAGTLSFQEWTNNFDVNKEFNIGLYKPLFLAAGAEYRRDSFKIAAGQLESYVIGNYVAPVGKPNAGVITQGGSQGVSGFSPFAAGDFKRQNASLYLNAEQKLTSNLEVSVAGRYEHYSDFGSTETYKISGRWEPIENYAVRGTISSGFRAPSLQQEHYGSSSTIGVVLPPATTTQLYPVQLLPPDNPAAAALGAKPLQPEKSETYSAGLVARPLSNLNITLDFYEIKIKNRILQTAVLGPSVAISNLLRGLGLNPQQAVFFYANAADTTTRGIDFVADYRTDFDRWGAVRWTLSANMNKNRFDRVIPPAFGFTLIDRVRQGDFTGGQPKDKEIVSADYTLGKFDATLRIIRYGELIQRSSNPLLDERIAPAGIADLDLSYQLTDKVKLSVGANNLTNYLPDVVQPANRGGANPFTYYNQYSPFGIGGGFYYAKINIEF